MNKIIVIILYIALQATIVWAGFAGPETKIQGNWGASDVDFGFKSGDAMDSFPGLVVVDEIGNVIIGDGVNSRIKIYDSSGNLQNSFSYKLIAPGIGWPATLRAKANNGIYSIYEQLQKYDYNGNLVWSVSLSGFEDYWVADDGGVWAQEYGKSRYNLYSPSGQFITSVTTRPLELGMVKGKIPVDGGYRHIIEYPGQIYSFIIPYRVLNRFQRDIQGNLHVAAQSSTTDAVYRVSKCGKITGQIQMPETVFGEPQKIGIEDVKTYLEEYGSAVFGADGNIYTWKRTPDKYSILKWTWVDDPNVPSGPDVPTGLTLMPSTSGLYLTWTASAQDPGCVTGYEISRATTAGGAATTVATVNAGVVKYNDSTASAGTTYYYKVRAKAGSEYSPYTSEVSGKR